MQKLEHRNPPGAGQALPPAARRKKGAPARARQIVEPRKVRLGASSSMQLDALGVFHVAVVGVLVLHWLRYRLQ